MASARYLTNWPGKSAPEPGGCEHPAVYHMLDVAAAAEGLIAGAGFEPGLRDALVLLTALHDLGKIGRRFRAMLREGRPQGNQRHWQVTEALLQHHRDLLETRLGGAPEVLDCLFAAVSGHHGRPPEADEALLQDWTRMVLSAGADAVEDSRAVMAAFADLWPDASLAGVTPERARALSWWLAGFVSTADWVGSNLLWFPPVGPGPDPAGYLPLARVRAAAALPQTGILPPTVSGERPFDFPELRPMQRAAQEIELPEGPTLALIEDETGAGKTEAALLLAQRMMAAGKGQGLFFALPTMATADAMFARVGAAVGRIFATAPSLTLAHGRAALSRPFRDLVGRLDTGPGEVGCTDWLADNRRRALLANVGVGTVDQALLGVLPTRYSTLRLYGLASKILLVDEAHELGDPYMAEELVRLLQAQRMLGGSAILMTATLPLALRDRLLATFDGETEEDAYPALTIAGAGARTDFPQATGPRGPVAVERLGAPEEAVELLVRRAAEGAACVWVRNAVDDAIAGAEALRERGVDVDLLHARFALADRKRIEAAALETFGKARAARPGRVLVGTQVIESSLDLDFDVMVSDLAPMAALIQRAGRLWRHMDRRPAAGRAVPAPVLHVLSPDPRAVRDARWLSEVLDRGAYPYPLDLQWRSALALFDAGRIEAPAGLRALIEAAHGETPPVPAALEEAELHRLGAQFAGANRARQNLVDLGLGYRRGGAGAEDVDYPTRLGQPQRVLALSRRVAGRLIPWAEGETPAESWMLSEVQANARWFDRLALPDQEPPEIAALTADWPEWRRRSITLCPVAEDGTICPGLRYEAERGLLFD